MQQPFQDRGLALFGDSSNSPAYPLGHLNYFNAPDLIVDGPKEQARQYPKRYTPSGSASPSVPQSLDHPPSSLSSASGASGQSTASSTVGSPYSLANHSLPSHDAWSELNQGLGIAPDIIHNEGFSQDAFSNGSLEGELCYQDGKFSDSFVDPSLIQAFDAPLSHNTSSALYPGGFHTFPLPSQTFQPPSPSPSDTSSYDSHRPGSARFRSGTASPYLHTSSFQPYRRGSEARKLSVVSNLSRVSQENARSASLGFEEDGKERGRCPNPDCGRLFKDLKAHMLTHQSERPEKCPIATCEYHHKGFARKYDKNRHTLTHYKGTMVCGFCPGSGSAAEKSFNRADVFKRHLTSLHGVEQTPPNSRKKSPSASNARKASEFFGDAAGKCSTCSAMFNNAQDFYEHLDDCVLRVVQQEEPSEAINEQHLAEVANDQSVLETLDRNTVHASANAMPFGADEDDEDDAEELKDETHSDDWTHSTLHNPRSGKGGNSTRKSSRGVSGGRKRGMTLSKGGVPLVGKGRKRRKHYPASWGCSADKMKMKKRVLCVYDGPRRLWKDDMMLDSQFEVRMRLGDSDSYVTDLDVNTLKRADAVLDATEEEKGPWMPEDEVGIQRLMS
ncbi:MAG: hypothetical protein LQ338_002430 [Usnochroma carphineum]|nr:MAG: hypothetical protein LQ338_002430 [Usnochroma carphineum]